ncbi:MAG: response regulator transcription factor [Dethiobacter sp.]|nr:response regulator transcription factor [Dethiobacter sp.]
MRVMVVDDEVLSRNELKFLLGAYPHIEVCGEAANGETALEMCKSLKPDAVFLDIQMPGIGGLAAAGKLMQQEEPPVIIFATAYDKHAIQAFELNAVDYLLKPFSQERLCHTVQRLEQNWVKKENVVDRLEQLLSRLETGFPQQGIVVKLTAEVDERFIVLNHTDLAFAYVEGRYVYLKIRDRSYRSRYSMKELEGRLPAPPFFRCHRGYLVNINWVKEIHPWFNGTYQLIVNDNELSEIPVSRLHVKEMKKLLHL